MKTGSPQKIKVTVEITHADGTETVSTYNNDSFPLASVAIAFQESQRLGDVIKAGASLVVEWTEAAS